MRQQIHALPLDLLYLFFNHLIFLQDRRKKHLQLPMALLQRVEILNRVQILLLHYALLQFPELLRLHEFILQIYRAIQIRCAEILHS